MEAEATDQGDGGNNDYLENYIHGGHHAILTGTLWSSSQITAQPPISDLSNIPPSRSTRSHVSAGSDGEAGTAAMATSDDPVNTLKIRTHLAPRIHQDPVSCSALCLTSPRLSLDLHQRADPCLDSHSPPIEQPVPSSMSFDIAPTLTW